MSMRTTWLAWSICALSLVLTGLGIGLLVLLNLSHPDVPSYEFWVHATSIAVAFSTVGALIASRRPEHPVGWLFCTIGLLVGIDHFCGEYAVYALLAAPESLPAAEAAAWVRSWIWVVSGGLGVFLVLLFPYGQLTSDRWRYFAWLNVIVIVLGSIAAMFSPGPIDGIAPIRNPLGLDSLGFALGERAVKLVEILQVGVALTALVSPFVRLRRAEFEERQQIKWFAYAATILVVGALLSSRVTQVWNAWFWWVGFTVYVIGIMSLPVAVGIAILRYHLYHIDLIINRTLVYGLLTATLALFYFGSVTALQYLLSLLTGQGNTLAIVASTLAIAALFNPLRGRIQSFIDRRFYRRKYDARKTLEAFSSRLRYETDLERISEDLLEVVDETMQPSHLSLWLRFPSSSPTRSEGSSSIEARSSNKQSEAPPQ
jgi:hypothetical protein